MFRPRTNKMSARPQAFCLSWRLSVNATRLQTMAAIGLVWLGGIGAAQEQAAAPGPSSRQPTAFAQKAARAAKKARRAAGPEIKPDYADLSYGPHPNNKL